jgi:hypothetical protein
MPSGHLLHKNISQHSEFRLWTALLIALFALRLVSIMIMPQAICHDGALELQCAQLLLDGKQPYVDFYEINPPLIIYLNTLPAALAKWLSVPVIPLFSVLLLLLILWSVLAIRRLLLRAKLRISVTELNTLLLLYAAVTLFLPRTDFGQREHLYFVLFFPYFILRWLRWEGSDIPRVSAIGLGIAAAIGMCLKPHFLLPAALLELYWVLRFRRVRDLLKPETVAVAVTGLIYALHFLLLPEAVRQSLFNRWIPFIADRYSVYEAPWTALFHNSQVIVCFALGVAALFIKPGGKGFVATLQRPLAIFTLSGVMLFFIQHKGWYYHTLPMLSGAVMLCGVLFVGSRLFSFADTPEGKGARHGRMTATRFFQALTVIILLYGVLTYRLWNQYKDGERDAADVRALIEEASKPGDPVLILSTSVAPAYPLLIRLNRKPGSRYLWHYPIGMFYGGVTVDSTGDFPYHTEMNVPPEERRYLAEISEDVRNFKPVLVIIDDRAPPQGCPPGFRLIDYFAANGFLGNQLQDYRQLDAGPGLHAFQREVRPES